MNRSRFLAFLGTSLASAAWPQVQAPAPAALATLRQQLLASPVRTSHRVMKPESQRLSAQLAAQLQAANQRTQGSLGNLPPASTLRKLRPCARTIQRIDNQGPGQAVLQPGQNLLLTGCFGGSPATTVTLRREGHAQSWQAPVIQATDDHVYARLPDVTGMADGPATIDVSFGDGLTSGSFPVRFVARRQTYEVSAYSLPGVVRVATGVPEVCSYQSCYWESGPQARDGTFLVQRQQPTTSEHRILSMKPGYHVVGYLVSLMLGAVADGGWGADGSVIVSFGTEHHAGTECSLLRFDRVFLEGPAGLSPFG